MTKKVINQKGKFDEELINTIEPNFIFADKPINRFNIINNNEDAHPGNKADLLKDLQSKINSIENCSLKDNSKNIVLGDGCLLYTSPSPRDRQKSRMPSSA